MKAMTMQARLGKEVAIDLCVECQAFWFDKYESLQLAPGSTLELLKIIGERTNPGVKQFSSALACPRCGDPLRLTNDMQRSTRFSYFRCAGDHGRFIRFFEFLREKDFIRPLTPQQIDELRKDAAVVNCSSCGAPIDLAKGSACAHCKSPISMLDMKQPEALVSQLREAAKIKPIDPALPLEMEMVKRDVERLFGPESPHPRRPSWSTEASSDLVHACLNSVSRWLIRNGF
jgi:DNA-directed RNA polymerase subunit RPC12/RpoP